MDLEGEQSPWKERVSRHWQRRCDTTDSSAEESLEVGCTARFERAQSPASLRRRWGRIHSESRPRLRRLCTNAFGPRAMHLLGGRTGVASSAGRFDCVSREGASASSHGVRDFARARPPVSAGVRETCSVTWGSASADRSIIAFGSRPALLLSSSPHSGSAIQLPREPGRRLRRKWSPSPFGGRTARCTGTSAHPPRREGTQSPTLGFGRGWTVRLLASAGGCTGRWSVTTGRQRPQ
jgi:hypothetical protein